MKKPLEHVVDFFPTGTAEGEREILDKVFVYVDEFSRVIAPPPGSPHLLVGTKGSGKSAVLNFSVKLLDAQNIPNVLITPFDVDTSDFDQNASTGDLARSMYMTLLNVVVAKLSAENSGLFDGDYATLYHDAVEKGLRRPDVATRIGRFISEMAKPILKADINSAFPYLVQSTQSEVEAAVSRIVGRNSFYLFIDDTDQVARPGVAGHLNRVWALLLAVRKLAYDIPNLNAVISLRTEVWHRLQRDDYGQRDQTDHFKRLVVSMRSDREHVGKIIDRRLSLAAAEGKSFVDGYQFAFDGPDARAPMSDQRRTWRDLILVRTRERPRDAIQLINEMAKMALDQEQEKITERIFQKVMPGFSKNISEQFGEEVRLEFPEAIEHLRALADVDFSQGGFTMTAEEAREHFSRMLSRYGATLHGYRLNQSSPDSPFEVWRFFYQAGVLNARVSDTSQSAGFSHLDPSKDPHLVTRTRWNELQSLLWEVNAVYRDYLIEIQREKSLKTGLPVKPRPRRKS